MSALQLEAATSVLGPVVDEVVFVGGATVYLWITDSGAPPVRATEDVDVVCHVTSLVGYYRLGEQLRERGLKEAADEPVICRWKSADPPLVLDVMPTDAGILGFSNQWYEEAIASSVTVTLDSGSLIRVATPAALIATKLAAWKGRGEGDLLLSQDILDVLTLIDGRRELAAEIEAASPDLRAYVRDELVELQTERDFDYAIDSATARYGLVGADRADLVRERIHQLIRRC